MHQVSGALAEDAAANYLASNGYGILERNWCTRRCEIDIVALKSRVAYLVEVKYRRSTNQGNGFDYITPAKLSQMRFAAQCWVAYQGWRGQYQLAVMSVTGADFTVTDFITDL